MSLQRIGRIMVYKETMKEVTARIKEQADIVQIIGQCVDLKRSGVRYLGLCPFHGEKTPSFSVHGGQQFFHCFGCGESGDVFSFLMKYYHLDFPSAVKELAERYHVELPDFRYSPKERLRQQQKDLLFGVNEKTALLYSEYLQNNKEAEAAREYLQKRGVGEEISRRFRIGYAPAVEAEGWNFLAKKLNASEQKTALEAGLLVQKERGGTYDRFRDRIVFPILDLGGRVCGFGGRIVGQGKPKYLNSPESLVFNKSKLLLGLYQQKEAIRKNGYAILVEGNFDLISLVAHGCENVVAPLGTALTREQLRLIKRFADGAKLLFDGDEAGAKAAVRSVPLFLAEQLPGSVAILPPGHDPDTFMREKGLQALTRLLEESESLPEFVLARLVDRYGLTLDGKSRIVEELQPLVKAAASPLQRSLFVSHFAGELGMDTAQLDVLLARSGKDFSGPPPVVNGSRPVERVAPLSIAQRQFVAFMILHPRFFSRLEEGGIREFLAGGVGEILFLQYKDLLAKNCGAEPEDLLTLLPEGSERNVVAELLLDAAKQGYGGKGGDPEEELIEMLAFLQRYNLQKKSDALMARIKIAEQEDDYQQLQNLMAENLKITRELHGE